MGPKETHEVVVVGAGIAGTMSAYRLAEDHDVLVIDKGQVAGDTTGRASGTIVTPLVYPGMPDLVDHVLEFVRAFDGTGNFEFNERRRINFVPPGSGENARAYAGRTEHVRFYPPGEANERHPGIDASEYDGIVEYDRTGYVDPTDYTHALKREAERAGAEFRTDVAVTEVLTDGDAVAGVETEYGSVGADHVVCAAGWATRPLLSGLLAVPVRPFRWESLDVDPGFDVPDDLPMGSEPTAGFYWRPAPNGNLHVGGNQYVVEEPGTRDTSVGEEFERIVREEVPRVLPEYDDVTVVGGEACPTGDAATPDTMAIIDAPEEAPDGLVIATGFQRGGVLTAPAAGTAVRSLVTGEPAPFPIEPFRYDRFDDYSAGFELGTIYPAYSGA